MATFRWQAKETVTDCWNTLFVEFAWSHRGKDAGGEMQFVCLRRSTRNTDFAKRKRVWFIRLLAYLDDSGMSLTIEQVVTQLQQEVITLKAKVACQTGLADAVRAINNLATTQVRKDTGLGRPKEFTGKEEDFQ